MENYIFKFENFVLSSVTRSMKTSNVLIILNFLVLDFQIFFPGELQLNKKSLKKVRMMVFDAVKSIFWICYYKKNFY